MKQILCFGDSNTWGYDGESGERLPFKVRWTGRLQKAYEEKDVRIIEEGLCGRTTVFEDPFRQGRIFKHCCRHYWKHIIRWIWWFLCWGPMIAKRSLVHRQKWSEEESSVCWIRFRPLHLRQMFCWSHRSISEKKYGRKDMIRTFRHSQWRCRRNWKQYMNESLQKDRSDICELLIMCSAARQIRNIWMHRDIRSSHRQCMKKPSGCCGREVAGDRWCRKWKTVGNPWSIMNTRWTTMYEFWLIPKRDSHKYSYNL